MLVKALCYTAALYYLIQKIYFEQMFYIRLRLILPKSLCSASVFIYSFVLFQVYFQALSHL